MNEVRLYPVLGIGEIQPGDDLVSVITTALAAQDEVLIDGDIIIITSKVISKAEGALRPGSERSEAIAAETKRIVARRGQTVIAETHHGFVMAAAGVDQSDVPMGLIATLPLDSDASARKIRHRLADQNGVRVAVIITDTFGRPWREGLVDVAIGAAGLTVLIDHRGKTDQHGRLLEASITAVADEIASASELVRAKSARVPVAILRGLSHLTTTEDGPGIAPLLRGAESDWFRLGHREVVPARRTIRYFQDRLVPEEIIDVALKAALTAPAPHHTRPWRFAIIKDEKKRALLLDAMRDAWVADLEGDGLTTEQAAQRTRRGEILRTAPALVLAFLVREGAHSYSDARRRSAEERMFIASGGAAIENAMIALAAEGVGSAWISSTLFCSDLVSQTLGLDPSWESMGAIAIGYPRDEVAERGRPETDGLIITI
jgi:coenzyme F420-0:L-glutamate ligase / coenzyme F420-1:gamma-L-glutamate ligase